MRSAVSRRYFLETIGRYCGRDLYLPRPIRLMMERFEERGGALLLPAPIGIEEAVRFGLDRHPDLVYEPLVVTFEGPSPFGLGARLVDFETLLVADSKLTILRNAQMSQILDTIAPLAAAVGLSATTIFGGVSQLRQVESLRRGVDIVVATPGRLEDLMGQRQVALDSVAVTVLDEADHMADLGFLPGVTRILKATPSGTQRLLFSATLDRGVDKLVAQFLHEPLVHSVDRAESAVTSMEHHVFLVPDAAQKGEVVKALAGGTSRRLLFTRTKHQAKKLARQLTSSGIPAVELHGNLSQNARERGLEAFASGDVNVMVATDIAARGIHVCLLYTSPSPRDGLLSRMPSSA